MNAKSRMEPQPATGTTTRGRVYTCDRCGFRMYEANCKVICPNCGSRYDCSDLTIKLDQDDEPPPGDA